MILVLWNIVVMDIVIVMVQMMMEYEQKNVICERIMEFCDDYVQVPVLFLMMNVSFVMKPVMEEQEHTIFSY